MSPIGVVRVGHLPNFVFAVRIDFSLAKRRLSFRFQPWTSLSKSIFWDGNAVWMLFLFFSFSIFIFIFYLCTKNFSFCLATKYTILYKRIASFLNFSKEIWVHKKERNQWRQYTLLSTGPGAFLLRFKPKEEKRSFILLLNLIYIGWEMESKREKSFRFSFCIFFSRLFIHGDNI